MGVPSVLLVVLLFLTSCVLKYLEQKVVNRRRIDMTEKTIQKYVVVNSSFTALLGSLGANLRFKDFNSSCC